MGAPIRRTRNSPAAVVAQLNKNGNPKTRFNSIAIKNIVTVNTIMVTAIRPLMLDMNREENMTSNKASRDCPTPKIKSYAPSCEKNRFDMNTPTTMPYIYFLLKTIR